MDAKQPTPATGGEISSRVGIRFYRYRGIIKRYWWVLAITVGLGLVYEAWVLFNKPTRYVSYGKLSVRETGGDQNSRARTNDPSWYGTIVKTIESPAVHERAVKSVAVLRPDYEPLANSAEVTAENEANTYFFKVTGNGPNPEFTQFFTDRVMEAFMEMRREESRDMMQGNIQQLVQQSEAERARIDQAQLEMNKFVEDNNVPFIEQQAEQIAANLADARKTREALTQDVNLYTTLDSGALLNNPASSGGGGTRSDKLSDKQQELAIKEDELKERSAIWKPAHPRYQLLVEEIDKLKISIRVLNDQAEKGRSAALARLKLEVIAKDKSITELEEKARTFSKIMAKYSTLKQEVQRREALYNQTRETHDKLLLTNGVPEILAFQQKATVATKENRGVVKGLLTGIIGGLLLGLAILFVMDRADDRFASSTEMIEQFSEPILAQLPDVADSRTNTGLPLLLAEDERYMYAEAYRSLRSSLIFMPNQQELKTLIVTSAIPNEGKSTIASNLAITMSNAGARVLLVDADLRRGNIAALFDTDGRQGLSNILRSEVPWQNCVKTPRGDKLHVIPRGPVTNQSSELLLLPILPKLLEEWKATFDLVIFNTAPILATDDTPTIAPNFDGTLMVIRASFTSARLTRNALNALYQRQVNVLGLILNCVDTDLPDYYYYRYPKYYAA